ncbi:type II toxin-antitoxin system HipA family toxin [Caballeronia sp. S22]|uniref:type II toxin-antitoxin system HipA family toxin n=1 Tax=Caballeronia sp. S22 TaxID=3137182 RepID=UPI0035308742
MTGAKHLLVFAHLDGNWTQCGRLTMIEQAIGGVSSTFEYDEEYLALSNRIELDPVSLSFADHYLTPSKPGAPANHLPLFGAFRDSTPDAFGRRVIERRLGAPLNSLAEAQYLLYAGPHRAGAFDFRLEALTEPYEVDESSDLEQLADAASLIDDERPLPAALEAIFTQGAGLGGARPKASFRDEHGVLWVSKFPTKSDSFDVASVEQATLTLAARTGVRVPELKTVAIGDRRVFLSRRFDRFWSPPGHRKSHTSGQEQYSNGPGDGRVEHRAFYISALSMTAFSEFDSRHASYADIAAAGLEQSRTVVGADDAAQIYKRMLIDIFVTNYDGHLRNTALLWNHAFSTWTLSPCFDVVPRPSLAFERFLHLQVGEHGRAATLDNAISWHQKFWLSEEVACEYIAEAWNVVRDWRQHFEDSGVDASDIERVAPAFRSIDDITSPELRRRIP